MIFQDITPSVLYHVYTEGELTREYDKGETRWQIDRADRRKLIAHLAFNMFQLETLTLDSENISSLISLYFHSGQEKLVQLTTDIRTCSFLTIDRHNVLRFAHKSFMEFYTSWHIAGLLANKRQAVEILGQRLFPWEILYFLGDLINSFFPGCIKILNELSVTNKNDVVLYNGLNLLNYSQHPITYLNKIEIQALNYVKLSLGDLSYNECAIKRMYFSKCFIKRFTINKTGIESLRCEGGRFYRISVDSSNLESWECVQCEISGAVSGAYLGALHLSKSKLHSLNINSSTIVPETSDDSMLQRVRFTNTLIVGNSSSHFKSCKMEEVVFEKCIFLGFDCSDSFISKASFKHCIFIRCYLDDEQMLNRLVGSRGYFIWKTVKGHTVQEKNCPIMLTEDRIKTQVDNFERLAADNEKEGRQDRLEFLNRLKWEEVLALIFYRSVNPTPTPKLFSEVQGKIKRIKDDLKSFCN